MNIKLDVILSSYDFEKIAECVKIQIKKDEVIKNAELLNSLLNIYDKINSIATILKVQEKEKKWQEIENCDEDYEDEEGYEE